jgi:hypothetical protein
VLSESSEQPLKDKTVIIAIKKGKIRKQIFFIINTPFLKMKTLRFYKPRNLKYQFIIASPKSIEINIPDAK